MGDNAVERCETRAARNRAEKIRVGMRGYVETLNLVAAAWESRDWETLGYADWSSYVDGEFGDARVRLDRETRQQAVTALRLAGMSTRAIAAVVDVDPKTVRADLAATGDIASPDVVTGADGKTYPASHAVTEVTAAEDATDSGAEPAVPDEWAPDPAGGGAVTSATPGNPTAEAPAAEPASTYGGWRQHFSARVAAARRELDEVTAAFSDPSTVAYRADDATLAELARLAAELADFVAEVRRFRSTPTGVDRGLWLRVHEWAGGPDAEVWMVTRKAHVYHRADAASLIPAAVCGLLIRVGVVMPLVEVESLHGRPCRRCWPPEVEGEA